MKFLDISMADPVTQFQYWYVDLIWNK